MGEVAELVGDSAIATVGVVRGQSSLGARAGFCVHSRVPEPGWVWSLIFRKRSWPGVVPVGRLFCTGGAGAGVTMDLLAWFRSGWLKGESEPEARTACRLRMGSWWPTASWREPPR
jgi:hypothetical protein